MATLKHLKKLLKKAGLKASGSKRALTRRAKKAHLLRGGQEDPEPKPKGQEKQEASKDQGSAAEEAEAKAREDRMAAQNIADAEAAAARGERAVPGGFWRRSRRMPRSAYGSVRSRRRGFF
jgi:hypothetical protein